MKVKSEREVAQSCPTLSDPVDCSPPGSPVHGIFQARVLEWGAIAFSMALLGAIISFPYSAEFFFFFQSDERPGTCWKGEVLSWHLREYLKRSPEFIAIGMVDKFSLTTFMECRAHDAGLGDRRRGSN